MNSGVSKPWTCLCWMGSPPRKLSSWVASMAQATCSSRDDFSPGTRGWSTGHWKACSSCTKTQFIYKGLGMWELYGRFPKAFSKILIRSTSWGEVCASSRSCFDYLSHFLIIIWTPTNSKRIYFCILWCQSWSWPLIILKLGDSAKISLQRVVPHIFLDIQVICGPLVHHLALWPQSTVSSANNIWVLLHVLPDLQTVCTARPIRLLNISKYYTLHICFLASLHIVLFLALLT